MTVCLPLIQGTELIGKLAVNDYNPQVNVNYINPVNNRNVQIVAEFDSGAFISLAPASFAALLGIPLINDQPINLQGVGGTMVSAYVHQINLQIGTDLYQGVDIAIASVENVPILIGRVNFWDLATITIDNTNRTICFTQISKGTPPPVGATYSNPTDYVWALGLYALAGLAIYSVGGY